MNKYIRRPSFKRKLRWRAEAWLLSLLVKCLHGRSHKTLHWFSVQVIRITSPLLKKKYQVATANLQRVYGVQITPSQQKTIAKRSIQSFALACLENLAMPISREQLIFEGEGESQLEAYSSKGQGIIIGSLHLGCWDIALRELNRRLPLVAVVHKPAHNPFAEAIFERVRHSSTNCSWISQHDRNGMVGWLKQGGALVIMTDIYNGQSDLKGDFLGLETLFSRGPFVLSRLCHAPLFPVAHGREDDGRFRLVCGAPIWPERVAITPDGSGDRKAIMKTCEINQAEALARWHEPWIQRYADQYYWTNRRWRGSEGRRLRQLPRPAERVLRLLPP